MYFPHSNSWDVYVQSWDASPTIPADFLSILMASHPPISKDTHQTQKLVLQGYWLYYRKGWELKTPNSFPLLDPIDLEFSWVRPMARFLVMSLPPSPPNWAESSSGPGLKNPNLANTSWYMVVSYITKTGIQQGVCHTVALPFTLNGLMLRRKKNYGNSNFSAWKNILLKKSSKWNQNPSRHYNSITNLKFQHKPKKYDLSKILT